mmetsp:Transcript_15680/g.11415  ORF Transcript_15680/g.11415 Transcript_15680/m.11415 type:complete len:82 (-) Transcript_15680:2578-2823(-)
MEDTSAKKNEPYNKFVNKQRLGFYNGVNQKSKKNAAKKPPKHIRPNYMPGRAEVQDDRFQRNFTHPYNDRGGDTLDPVAVS